MKKQWGFTLIELVIVIAILGILAALAIPRFLNSTATANGSRLLGDLRTIDSAIMIFNTKTGAYPASLDELVNGTSNCGSLLAASPVPPSGSMRVTRNDGSEFTYEPSDNKYIIDATTGRATYTCSTGTGDVDWYLKGEGNSDLGLTVASGVNLQGSLNAFFISGWQTGTTDKNASFTYKVFTVDGKNYAIIIGDSGGSSGDAKKTIGNIDDAVYFEGSQTVGNESVLQALSTFTGTTQTIDSVSFDGTTVNGVTYKNN